jgi:hypothetical protein
MSDTDDTQSLSDQRAAHRMTLAVYLRQRASLGAAHARAALHDAGVAVVDHSNDIAPSDDVGANLVFARPRSTQSAVPSSAPSAVHVAAQSAVPYFNNHPTNFNHWDAKKGD